MRQAIEQIESLQNLLIARATGSSTESDTDYANLREALLQQSELAIYVPPFMRTCRNLSQFWQFIKHKFGSYAERRDFIWNAFRPITNLLESLSRSPADRLVSFAIEKFDAENIQTAWTKALDRRVSDPEGAITIARTLLESVCKHILEEAGADFNDSSDLPKLYRQTAEQLKIAPSQHTEAVFKQILGGCTAVVEGLGALRNRLSDSHGKGKVGVKPAARHAELAVNLAGALSLYLLATWEARNESLA